MAWRDGLDLYLLEAPDGDWRTEPWTWTRIANGGANPGAASNGSYSKFQWVDELGIAIIAPAFDGPVFAVKLMEGVVPRPPREPDPARDAGVPRTDSGVPPTDGSTGRDGGESMPLDSSTVPDAGVEAAPDPSGGCECGVVGLDRGPWLLGLALLLFCLAQRGRTSRP